MNVGGNHIYDSQARRKITMLNHLKSSVVECSICVHELSKSEMVLFCEKGKHFMCTFCAKKILLEAANRETANYVLKREPVCSFCRSEINFLDIFVQLCERAKHHGRKESSGEDSEKHFNLQDMEELVKELRYNRHFLLYALVATNAYKLLPTHTLETFARKQYADNLFVQIEKDEDLVMDPLYRTADDAEEDPDDWQEPAETCEAALMEAFLHKKPAAMRILRFEFQTNLHVSKDYEALGLADVFEMFCRNTEDSKLEILHELVSRFGFDCNDSNSTNSVTILHHACEKGYGGIVRELLEGFEAKEDPEDRMGLNPVEYAIEFGHTNIALFFLDEFTRPFSNARKYALQAAKLGHTDMLRAFEKNGYINFKEDEAGCSEALVAAVQGDHLETVEMLVQELFADATIVAKDGYTLVHSAAKIGDIDLIRFLVHTGGADASIATDNGWTPLHFAADNGHSRAVHMLVQEYKADPGAMFTSERGLTPVHMAAEGDVDTLRVLLRLNVDVNVLSRELKTPLYYACMAGNVENVLALVQEFGVDATAQCNLLEIETWSESFLDTPLSIAVYMEDLDMVKTLIETCKVVPDRTNILKALRLSSILFNSGIMIYLIKHFDIDVNECYDESISFRGDRTLFSQLLLYDDDGDRAVALIKKCGANPNARDRMGETALMYAIRVDKEPLALNLLLECRADPHVVNRRGDQAIHVANGKMPFIEMILNNTNVDVNVVNADGKAISHLLAEYGGFEDLGTLIKEYGVDVNLRDKQGNGFLHLGMDYTAITGNDIKWIHILIHHHGAQPTVRNNKGDTILHAAAMCGNRLACDYLLRNLGTLNIRMKNSEGETPFHAAAKNNGYGDEGVDTLLHLYHAHAANPEESDNAGRTPFMVACSHLHAWAFGPVIKALVVECGVNVRTTDGNGWTALFHAAGNGKVSTVLDLLDKYRANDPPYAGLEHRSNAGETAIFVAAENGHTDVVMVLLRHGRNPMVWERPEDEDIRAQDLLNQPVSPQPARAGANAATPNSLGCTPVWAAASNGHINTVRILVRMFHVDPKIPNNDGENALHAAARRGHVETVSVLVNEFAMTVHAKSKTGQTPLHYAAQNHHYKLLFDLLSTHGANVNAVDNTGQTIIFYHMDPNVTTKLVLEFNMDPDWQDGFGYTALQKFILDGNVLQVHALVSKCFVAVDVFNVSTYSPLSLAVIHNRREIVELLLQQSEANVNLQSSNNGQLPVHLAAQHCSVEMVRLLVEFGAETQGRDIHGNTPIFYAVQNTTDAQSRILKYLLRLQGVDVNARNEAGETAILVAAKRGPLQALSTLCEHGADLGLTYPNGETLRDYAERRGPEYVNAVERAAEINRVFRQIGLSMENMKMLHQFQR